MENSILKSIKEASGVNLDDSAFDGELILHTNTAFMTLRQIGVGPEIAFSIEDDTSTWNDFIDDDKLLPMVKSYVALKVRRLFDPPTSSSLDTALENVLNEYEWRLNIEGDKYSVEAAYNHE